MGKGKNKFIFLAVLILVSGIWVFRESLLVLIGRGIIHEAPLRPVDAIVVLAGSSSDSCLAEGVGLIQKGFAKYLVFTGHQIYPGMMSHDLMRDHALKLGLPENRIITGLHQGKNVRFGQELNNLKLMNDRKIRSFAVVTPPFYTQVEFLVFKKLIADLGYDMKHQVVQTPVPHQQVDNWWKTRGGMKNLIKGYLEFINLLWIA